MDVGGEEYGGGENKCVNGVGEEGGGEKFGEWMVEPGMEILRDGFGYKGDGTPIKEGQDRSG